MHEIIKLSTVSTTRTHANIVPVKAVCEIPLINNGAFKFPLAEFKSENKTKNICERNSMWLTVNILLILCN